MLRLRRQLQNEKRDPGEVESLGSAYFGYVHVKLPLQCPVPFGLHLITIL